MEPLLQVEDLSISFHGLAALSSVSFELKEGEIMGLIGPNGSGKTTLINCISNLCKPSRGRIRFRGKDLLGKRPCKVITLGISRTFQNLEVNPRLRVIDNVMLGMHSKIGLGDFFPSFFSSVMLQRREWDWHNRDKAFKVIDLLGIASYHDRPCGGLSFGLLKLVELARAVASNPSLLLLDEPTAGMNEQETYEMGRIITELRDYSGMTILLIEHDLNLVQKVCDVCCVLNFGVVIAKGEPQEVMLNPNVIEAYVGGEQPWKSLA
jgi:branched-chain amino acid transport system ATP-binding protein